jgi:predicted GNAT family N-acyltransferase
VAGDELSYIIEPLGDSHDRATFSCGVEELDRYLQRLAGQDIKKRVAAVFVLTLDGRTIAGFYSLSAHMLKLDELPLEIVKRLPRYPNVPATLLGRLAVGTDFRGRGLGELLLIDALKRSLAGTTQIASAAVVVDAKNEHAREFYQRHEFLALASQPNRLFLLMKTIEQLFSTPKS